MIKELNAECNESLCFTYVMNWEIYSYNSEKLWDKYYGDRIRANNFRELIEKAMKKLGLNLEISQEEEEEYINAKKKTLEKLIKQENQKKLLINFCDWWDKNYFKNDDSVTEEDLGIGANEVDEFLANLNEI